MKSKESKARSTKEIEFDAKLLLLTLRDHANHLEGKKKLTLRATTARPRESSVARSLDPV